MVNNIHWNCSIMKIYIICCVPAQILCLGKILFLRYKPKWSQPVRFQDFLNQHFSRTNQWNSIILCMLIQIFWLDMVKYGGDQPGPWTLKLTVSPEWTDGITWFFAWWHKFIQIKRWAWSKMGLVRLIMEF